MSLESHYELGTDVALSILAVIITMVDNHSFIFTSVHFIHTQLCMAVTFISMHLRLQSHI